MQQNWSIRSRAHECALTGRPFEDGEIFHTAIYFDPQENGYVRKDVCREAWKDQLEKQKPVASWKTMYQKVMAEPKPEIAPKESAMELLQRFIEDGDPMTENARYILALMLERKRQIVQTAEKEVDGNKMLFYENKKTGEIFIVRDPELRLDEVAQIQEEVATILAFGGPAVEAAKAAGVTLTPDGVVPAPDANAAAEGAPAADAAPSISAAPVEPHAPDAAAPEDDKLRDPAAEVAPQPGTAADPPKAEDASEKAMAADDSEDATEEESFDEPETADDDAALVEDIPEEGIAENQALDIRIGQASALEEPPVDTEKDARAIETAEEEEKSAAD